MRLARCDICRGQLFQRAYLIRVRGVPRMTDILCRRCFRFYGRGLGYRERVEEVVIASNTVDLADGAG